MWRFTGYAYGETRCRRVEIVAAKSSRSILERQNLSSSIFESNQSNSPNHIEKFWILATSSRPTDFFDRHQQHTQQYTIHWGYDILHYIEYLPWSISAISPDSMKIQWEKPWLEKNQIDLFFFLIGLTPYSPLIRISIFWLHYGRFFFEVTLLFITMFKKVVANWITKFLTLRFPKSVDNFPSYRQ